MLDITRHVDVFDPETFKRRVDVIGCGATGSRVILELSKLGISEIHAWDGDIVEPHNLANQVFSQAHLGQPKAMAIRGLVSETIGEDVVIPHREYCDGTQQFGDVVFLLTDTMQSRKDIFTKAIKLKIRTKLLIETRMGVDEGRLYCFNPMKPSHIRGWEATLYDDDEAEVSACGGQITVGSTAAILAGMAVWAMISWYQQEDFPHETLVYLLPPTFISRTFD